MINTNIANFRKNIFKILQQTIKFNQPVNVSIIPGLKEDIVAGMNTPIDECLPEEDVGW